jgi:hypothetical protein
MQKGTAGGYGRAERLEWKGPKIRRVRQARVAVTAGVLLHTLPLTSSFPFPLLPPLSLSPFIFTVTVRLAPPSTPPNIEPIEAPELLNLPWPSAASVRSRAWPLPVFPTRAHPSTANPALLYALQSTHTHRPSIALADALAVSATCRTSSGLPSMSFRA